MDNLSEKCEHHQTDLTVNESLGNQTLQRDSVQCELICNCEQQHSGTYLPVKQELSPYLPLKQELSPVESFQPEETASSLNLLSRHNQHFQEDETIISTQHQEHQADTDLSVASSKEYNGV